MAMNEEIIKVLKTVVDPEINLDIWTLGLIYGIKEMKDKKIITMTLTSPMCPYGPQIIDEVKSKVSALPDIKEVEVVVTFDPPWKPSDDLRKMLGV